MNQPAEDFPDNIIIHQGGEWWQVIFASDCEPCDCCGEPLCAICEEHYSNCDCPGPTQDCIEYQEFNGVLYGRKEDG